MPKSLNDLDQTQLLEDVAREHFNSRGIEWSSLNPNAQFVYKESILGIQTTVVAQIKAQLNED